MNKKIRFKNIILLLIMFVSLFFVGGCYEFNQQKVVKEYVVSYVSTDSTVYSSTAEVVNEVADAVVEISTESIVTNWGMQYIVSGAGSGVIVSKSDTTYYIVTNNHVIEDASDIKVRTRVGNEYEATLVATDDSADIAVIEITTNHILKVATWGDSDDLQVGEDLIAIGNPLGSLGGTVTKGILSAKGRKITVGNYSMTLLQTDTAINPGNSGGGLFNMRGELIGVVNAKTSDEEVEGICFAIPSNDAKSVYDSLLTYGYLKGRATLSIEIAEGTISSSGINTQSESIVYVTKVLDGGNNTFKQYDRIYSVNGQKVTSIANYNDILSTIKPNQVIEIEVYRGQITQSIFGNSISFETKITKFNVTATQYGI